MNAKAISENQQKPGCSRFGLGVFGLAFFSAGCLFLYFGLIRPTLQSRAAQQWPTARCTILTATRQAHHSDDGVSYSAEFTYRYQVGDRTLTGTRYSFSEFSGTAASANRILDQYPVGTQTQCYYDPENPASVVLDRDNRNLPMWLGLITLPFILVGLAILGIALFGSPLGGKQGTAISAGVSQVGSTDQLSSLPSVPVEVVRSNASRKKDIDEADQLDIEWTSPRKLTSASSRLVIFILIGVFALFWNGIIGIIVVNGIMGMAKFHWTGLLFALFLTPFVLIGIGMLVACGYFFLSLFNPKVEIALSSGAVPLGGDVDIAWEVDGKVERIRRLTIEVHAVQAATYVRGTDTVTETEVFELIPVADITATNEVGFGSGHVVIPGASMHTLEAKHNKISWSVEVHGEIPWAPDIHESFPFRVMPGPQVAVALGEEVE